VFPAHVVEVAIASSDDTDRFRTAIGRAMNWWNRQNAERYQILLMPSGGRHRTANGGGLDHCDVVIAVVDPMGPTADESLRDALRAKQADKLVFAWFITESPSTGLDPDDQALLAGLTKEGISPRYIGHGDTHFESRLHDAMTVDLAYANLSLLKEQFESIASARRVTIYRTPVPLLGPGIFAVTVANDSRSLAVELKVRVDAVDYEGNPLPDGVTRSKQELADVFAKLRTSTTSDGYPPLIEPGAESVDRGSVFPLTRMNLLAAHTALDFPRWLRPKQYASALYAVQPNALPHVHIQFEDQAGEVWSRTNDSEPQRIAPPGARRM
jgi:hypothetical protein